MHQQIFYKALRVVWCFLKGAKVLIISCFTFAFESSISSKVENVSTSASACTHNRSQSAGFKA